MSKKGKKKNQDKRQGVVVTPSKSFTPVNEYLCVRGPIYGPSGYARMTRNVIEGLHKAGKRFWIDILPWAVQPSIEVTEEFKNIFVANMPTREDAQRTNDLLIIALPTDIPNRPLAPNTWNMTLFETTRIPAEWIKLLNYLPLDGNIRTPAIKGLILPSKGNLESFGEVIHKKKIVPLAIDYDIFNPDGPAMNDYLPERGTFNILLSYHQNPRKNSEFAIRLINELDSGTTVYLKTFGQGMSTWERESIIKGIKCKMKSDAAIVLLYDMISDEDQAKMYRSMDLVLNLSHGEGWDLPRCEAYACGVPAIGPLFIAPEDYTIPEFRLISHNLVPCPEMPPYFSSSAKWAELDLIDCIQAVGKIRDNREKYRGLALKQREHLIQHTGTLADMGERVWNAIMG